MQTAILSPFSSGPSRGNITTVNRISRNIASIGIRNSIFAVDAMQSREILQFLISSPPDLIHAFHAYYCGPAAEFLASSLQVPYIITITGSDLFDPAFNSRPETAAALQSAASVTCFDPVVNGELLRKFPFLEGRTVVVPQGVEPLPPSPLRQVKDNEFIILLPAALRQAKGIFEAIEALAPLARRMPAMKLLIAGGDIDAGYAERVRELVSGLEWVELAGDLPHEQMGGIYASSHLVLNSSLFEGGMPNVLLEAMSMGRPVVARDIPGNRSVVRDGETGWLYRGDQELRDIVCMLAEKPGLRESAGRAASIFADESFSATKEAAAYSELYRTLAKP